MGKKYVIQKDPMAKALTVPPAFRHCSIPGQVPSQEHRFVWKEAQKISGFSKPKSPLAPNGVYLTVNHVVGNLGMSYDEENKWRTYLAGIVQDPNELTFRQKMMTKMRDEALDPTLRNALFQRTMMMRRDTLKKSQVRVHTVDELKKSLETPQTRFYLPGELKKGDARGGTYYRRSMTKSGKHRYFYNEGQYKNSKDAHVSGEEASKCAIRKSIDSTVGVAKKGVKLKELNGLVKKYGSKLVGSVLQESCGPNGGLSFEKGCVRKKVAQ